MTRRLSCPEPHVSRSQANERPRSGHRRFRFTIAAIWSGSKMVRQFFAAAGTDRDNAEWFKLDGRSHAIHAANKACGLNLTEKNVLDYLRFFCGFLDMKDGQRTQITGDTVCWFSRVKIVQAFRPTMDGMSEGNFLCTAHAVYAGSVFKTAFSTTRRVCGNAVESCD